MHWLVSFFYNISFQYRTVYRFSREIMRLKLGKSDRGPSVILYYYLQCVSECGGEHNYVSTCECCVIVNIQHSVHMDWHRKFTSCSSAVCISWKAVINLQVKKIHYRMFPSNIWCWWEATLSIIATHRGPHCIEIVLIKPDLWPLYNGQNLWFQWWPL